jgi:hypothetical protein
MATQVEMRVGGNIISVLHIARTEGEPDKHSINNYIAAFRRPGEQPDWHSPDMVEFEHRYGDGIQELVRKALNAIKDSEELG